MISPEVRHNFLLSSSTVFIFSIHTASTGPSKTTHYLSSVLSCAHSLIIIAMTPSDQDLVSGSSRPYNWSLVIDLGLSLLVWTI